MTWSQRLLSAAAVAVIFACGFLTGRLGTPAGDPATEAEAASPGPGMRTTAERLAFLDERLDLDDGQEEELTRCLEAWERDMRAATIDNDRRSLEIFENHYPPMRAVMRDDQAREFESIMRQIRKRKQQSVQRKQRLFDRHYGS